MMNHHYTFLRLFILLSILFGVQNSSTAQTLMPLPPHSMVYPGNVRGYWFTAPVSFTITGLKVSQDAGTGLQYIHVFKINDATPVVYPTTSSNFTTLAYIQGATNNVLQTVSISVNAGDKIGILGAVAGSSASSMNNSYGGTSTASNTTTIGTNSVVLNRLLYQGAIVSAQAPNYSTEPTAYSISRVEMWYSIGPICPVPTGTAVSGITMTSANFSWNAVTASLGYEYAITTTSTPPLSGTPTSLTSYNATGLNNGTNYWFHVRNQCSATSYSAWSTIPFTTTACPAVTGVVSSGITTVAANVNWNAVSGTLGYEYSFGTTSTPPATGTPTTATSYSASGLTPGTTYYFHVRNKCTAPSNSVWTTISFPTLPCPSAGIPVIGTNVPGTVSYSWTGSSTAGVAGYQYAVTTTNAAPTIWNSSTTPSVTVNGLIPGTTYYAQVRTSCGGTQSPWQYVQFINPFPPCYAPAAITISDINMHGANIAWDKSTTIPPAQDYQYVVTTNTTAPSTGTTTTDTFYTPTTLAGGTKYYVWVRTHCGTTNYSGWTKDSILTPSACLNSVAPNITNVTANSADITWQNFPGIYGYEYLIDFSSGSPTIPAVPVFFNAVSPVNLASGTTYYFHLRTRCDTFNFSPWINEAFTTNAVCTNPSNLSMTGGTATTASFGWQAVPGAQNYQYSVTTGTAPVPGNTYTTGPNVTAIGLTPGTSYYFHVRALCSGSDSSEWVSMPFNTFPTSVGNVSGNNGFIVSVYPNPVKDMLTIQVDGVIKGKGIIGVYDLSGKLVKQTGILSGKSQLDISDLGSGIYLLRYTDNETSGVMRIQKL